MRLLLILPLLGLLHLAWVDAVDAHSQLGIAFKKKYRLRTVSCNTCHLKAEKKKKRDALTPFGKELAQLLEGKQISDRLEASKKESKEQRDQVKDAVVKEFLEALDKLDALEAPSGKLYAEAIPAGEIEGTKVRR